MMPRPFPPILSDLDEAPAVPPAERTDAALSVLGLFSCLLNRGFDVRQVHRLYLDSIRAALDLGLGRQAEDYVSAWQMFTRVRGPVPALRRAPQRVAA